MDARPFQAIHLESKELLSAVVGCGGGNGGGNSDPLITPAKVAPVIHEKAEARSLRLYLDLHVLDPLLEMQGKFRVEVESGRDLFFRGRIGLSGLLVLVAF